MPPSALLLLSLSLPLSATACYYSINFFSAKCGTANTCESAKLLPLTVGGTVVENNMQVTFSGTSSFVCDNMGVSFV